MLAYGSVFHLLPRLRYENAVKLLNSGDLTRAHTALESVGTYRDAPELLLSCTYLQAQELLEKGDEVSLREASVTFGELGDYRDSADQKRQADYLRACLLLESGRADAAESLFLTLGEDYQDTAERLKRCDYLQAQALAEAGEWTAAQAAFEALGDYSDAAAQAAAAALKVAEQLLKAGDYIDARTILNDLDQSDSGVLRARHMASYL